MTDSRITEHHMTDLPKTDPAAPRLGRKITGALRRLVFGRVPKLFDSAHYLRSHSDAAASALDPYLHYVLIGGRRNYDPNGDFDTAFYRTQAKAGRNPLRHFIRTGAAEGFDPHPQFSTLRYLGRYPDVAAGRVNPLLHYRQDGRPERRIADPSTRLPRTTVALAGIPSAHHWVLPSGGQARFELTLLRAAPHEPGAEAVPRLRLSLGLEFDVVDRVVDALARFPAGIQDAVHLVIPAEGVRGGGIASLILALDHCRLHPIADDGTRTIHYAEAVLWDIRPTPPHVLTTLPDGAIRV